MYPPLIGKNAEPYHGMIAKPVIKYVVVADSIAVMPTALDNTLPVMTMGVQSNDSYGNTLCGNAHLI